jgi:hypothetical protein
MGVLVLAIIFLVISNINASKQSKKYKDRLLEALENPESFVKDLSWVNEFKSEVEREKLLKALAYFKAWVNS